MSSVNQVVLLPKNQTWAHLVALFIRCWVAGGGVVSRSFKETCRVLNAEVIFADQLGNAAAAGLELDIEVRRQWRQFANEGVRSPVSMAVWDEGITEDEIEGIEYVQKIMDDNNDTGYLKQHPESLVELVRNLGAIGSDQPSAERRLEVIEMLWPAVWAYFAAPQSGSKMGNPFVLSNVLKLMAAAGVPDEERQIWRQRIERAFARSNQQKALAAQKVKTAKFEKFPVSAVNAGEVTGHFIRTDDTRVAAAGWRQYPEMMLLVVQRRSGHVAIMCRGQQRMDVLYLALEEAEPGRWFHKSGDAVRHRSPIVQNGGTIRDPAPTSLLGVNQQFLRSKLYEILRVNYRHTPRGN